MKIIDKIDDSFDCGKRFIYVIELESNVYADIVQVLDDDYNYFFYVLDESAYTRNELNEINRLYDYMIDENKVYEFLDKQIKG